MQDETVIPPPPSGKIVMPKNIPAPPSGSVVMPEVKKKSETEPQVERQDGIPVVSESDLSLPVEQPTPLGEKSGTSEPIDLPSSYQSNRSNYKDLVAGQKYKLIRGGKPVAGTWNGETFVKDPLINITPQPKKTVGYVEAIEVGLDPTKTPMESEEDAFGRAAVEVDDITKEAADKIQNIDYLSSFGAVQRLAELEKLQQEGQDVQAQIDELKSRKLDDKDWQGIRLSQGEEKVYQNLEAPKLEPFYGETQPLPKTDMTVGEAYQEAKDDSEYVNQAKQEIDSFNSAVENNLVSKLEPDVQQYVTSLKGTPEYEAELEKALVQSKEVSNMAPALMFGLGHKIDALMELGSNLGLNDNDLGRKKVADRKKKMLFGKEMKTTEAEIANSIGGMLPDISAGLLASPLMMASMMSTMPNDFLEQSIWEDYEAGRPIDIAKAKQYALSSTATQGALLMGAGKLGAHGLKLVGKGGLQRAAQLTTEIAKRGTKDALIFGYFGTKIQNQINKAYKLSENNDYLNSMLHMFVIGGMFALKEGLGQGINLGKAKRDEIDYLASYLPTQYTRKQVEQLVELGKISKESGEETLTKLDEYRVIRNQIPVEDLSMEQMEKIYPLWQEARDIKLQMKEDIGDGIRSVYKGQLNDLEQKILIEAAVPLTGEEKVERKTLIQKQAEAKPIDEARLKYLDKRAEAAKEQKAFTREKQPGEVGETQTFDRDGKEIKPTEEVDKRIVVEPTKGYSFEYKSEKDIPKELSGIEPISKSEIQVGKDKKIRVTFSGKQLLDAGLGKENIETTTTEPTETPEADTKDVSPMDKVDGENKVSLPNETSQKKQEKPISTSISRGKEADAERTNGSSNREAKRKEIKSALTKLRDEGLLRTADKTLIGKIKGAVGVKPALMTDAEIDVQMALMDAMADTWYKTTGKDDFYESFIADVKKGDINKLREKGGALFQDSDNPKSPSTKVTLAIFDAPQFEKMKGQQVSPQSISDLAKGRGKQIEKDIINMVLDFDKYKGQKRIPFDDFRNDVDMQVMKLEKIRTDSYANYGHDNLGYNENYGDRETIIFNSPIEHGEKGHFGGDFTTEGIGKREWELRQIPNTDKWAAVDKNMPSGVTQDNVADYVGTAGSKSEVEKWIDQRSKLGNPINRGLFGHIRRWFNKRTGVFNIAELQSDYFQKNKASDLLKPEVSQDEVDAHMNKNVWNPMDVKIAERIKNETGITTREVGGVFFAFDKDGKDLASEQISNEPYMGLERGDYEKNNIVVRALRVLSERTATDEKTPDGKYEVTTSEERYNKSQTHTFNTEKETENFIKNYDGRFNGSKKLYDDIKDEYYESRKRQKHIEEQKFIQKRQEELAKEKPENIQLKQFVASQKVHELRLLREAIKTAAEEGATTVRFPDEYTIAVIEGYVDKSGEGNAPYDVIEGNSDRLYEGDVINYGGSDMIVVEQNRGSITVAPKDEVMVFDRNDYIQSEVDNRLSEIKYEAEKHFEDLNHITKAEVESYQPEEWIGEKAKEALEKKLEGEDEDAYVKWSYAEDEIVDHLYTEYNEMSSDDLVEWASNVWQDGDTIYASESRNYETFQQPDQYEPSSTKDDYYDNLSSEQKTVVDKYGELGKEFQKMRPDAKHVTDDNDMGWWETKITDKDKNNPIVAFQEEGGNAKGAIDFANDNKATIHIFDGADISTLAHEMSGHLGRRVLEKLAEVDEGFAKQYESAKKWAGVKDTWTTRAEEKFARGFERYLIEGNAPTKALKEVFGKLKEWLSGIYKTIKGSSIDVKLTDDVKGIFDSLLGKENATSEPKEEVKQTESPIGKTITFPFAGNETKGVVKSIDEKGNYKVVEKDGTKHTVKPEDAIFETQKLTGVDLIKEGLNDLKEGFMNPTGGLMLNPKYTEGLFKITKGMLDEGWATSKNIWDKMVEFLKKDNPNLNIKDLEKYRGVVEQHAAELERKSFLDTLKDSPQTSEGLKEKSKELNEFYEVFSNKKALSAADAEIKKDLSDAKKKVLSDTPPSAEKSAMAIRLIKHFEKAGDLDSAIEIIDSYDKQLREAGRFIQAASLWNKLAPETVLRNATKLAEKDGKELSPEVKKEILKRFGEIDKMPEGDAKSEATLEALNYIAEQMPHTWSELFDAYRYQNMLSNPKSHLRNIYGNLFNTFLTEPVTIGVKSGYDFINHPFNPLARDAKFANVPQYYKDILSNIPEAFSAAAQTYRRGYVAEKILDAGSTGNMVEAIRRTKLPRALTVVTRFLEAQDRFFSVLISQGEKARLMRQGVSESKASEEAMNLANEYLYRDKLDPSDKTKLASVRAFDALGQGINHLRKQPIIGKPLSWFAPFITTPINVAKMGVKFSPIAAAEMGLGKMMGREYNKTQIAQATIGTILTGVGATMAMQGLTTWAAPRDKKEKEMFYASGRKPYSVKIGEKWVPMAYFGPLALTLALPASIKHFQEDSKTALTDSDAKQISDAIISTSGYVMSQTPLTGVGGFIETLMGQEDASIYKALGYNVNQIIPLSGMVRYINTILDPVYRRAKGFTESIEAGLPELSKELEPIKEPSGEEAKREPINYVMPYDLGMNDEEYGILLKRRREILQQNALRKNKSQKPERLKKMDKLERLKKAE